PVARPHESRGASPAPVPTRLARPPVPQKAKRAPAPSLAGSQRDLDRLIECTFDLGLYSRRADLGDAAAGEAHRGTAHLLGNLPPACVAHMINGDGDGSEQVELLPLGRARLEPALEFLGDETGGEPALAPAWVTHERGKEWNVVLNPIDYEGIEGAGLQIDGSRTRSRMGHQLGEHRIVKHGD